jgi:hypothetical protein
MLPVIPTNNTRYFPRQLVVLIKQEHVYCAKKDITLHGIVPVLPYCKQCLLSLLREQGNTDAFRQG